MQSKLNTKKIVLLAILTAIVIVLQLLASLIRFGPFSIQLVMIPIVIGAALLGRAAGAWLGLVFSVVVLVQPDTAAFWLVSPHGTVITVLLKGTLAGLIAGIIYSALNKFSITAAALVSAIASPIVNTGIFIIGSYVFFYNTLIDWAIDAGAANVTAFIFLGMVGVNFLIELGVSLIMCTAIIRLIKYGQKTVL